MLKSRFVLPLLILLQALWLVTFSSCYEENWEIIAANQETSVSGSLYDYTKEKAISGAKIYVAEYVADPSYRFFRNIDSTQSDLDGKYSIKFKTTGVGVQYQVAFSTSDRYSGWAENLIYNIGGNNSVDFHLYKLYVLQARLRVHDNPRPPLRVVATYENFPYTYVTGQNKDTTAFFYVHPRQPNYFSYQIVKPDSLNFGHYYNKHDSLTLSPPINDTVRIELDIFPATFKRN